MERLLELLKVKQLIVDRKSTFALTEEGGVFAWGNNDSGQLGLGNNHVINTPTEITIFKENKVEQFIVEFGSNFALTKGGGVFAWGHNYSGQLGLGDNNERLIPTEVTSLNSHNVKQ